MHKMMLLRIHADAELKILWNDKYPKGREMNCHWFIFHGMYDRVSDERNTGCDVVT